MIEFSSISTQCNITGVEVWLFEFEKLTGHQSLKWTEKLTVTYKPSKLYKNTKIKEMLFSFIFHDVFVI